MIPTPDCCGLPTLERDDGSAVCIRCGSVWRLVPDTFRNRLRHWLRRLW